MATVKLPSEFVTLDDLAYQIALAVSGLEEPPPERLENGSMNPEAIGLAGTHINWEDKIKKLYRQGRLPGRNPMSKERLGSPVVSTERVLFFIGDLQACDEVRDGFLEFVVSKPAHGVELAPGLLSLPEVAAALESRHGVSRDALFQAMGDAAALRELKIRDPGTGGYFKHEGYVIPEHTYVRAEDVDEWLEQHYGVPYRLIPVSDSTESPETGRPDSKPSAAPAVLKHSTRGRKRDDLSPVIEAAQERCRNRYDAAEVWNQLLTMADERHPPLQGCAEGEIKYSASGEVKFLTRKQLGDRIRRDRERAEAR